MVSFWNKVNKNAPNGCWEWIASAKAKGYGRVWFQGKVRQSHRVAYQLTYGIDPKELFVCHKCDNRGCMNPEHLFLGTQSDNMKDMVRKGRASNGGVNQHTNKTHCKRGHQFITENFYLYDGRRYCKICTRERRKK